ncbi:hypothetical protein AB0469_35170 [Streptomyces sp. NPDC093801]|uniref:hypothetical protein n=1 Tax=Streptomyces sp. NPDC093801 TaxID=3155203 RepID=UPI00344D90CC
MADGLYQRYMKAAAEYRTHAAQCRTCTQARRCTDGQRLFESFARLQDAYLAQQRRPRG